MKTFTVKQIKRTHIVCVEHEDNIVEVARSQIKGNAHLIARLLNEHNQKTNENKD